ncbi:ataxin-7-like protein 2 [Microcaecilia unicolor]|uniref:Ataxin-7-like protein 2 n=1 Tax=Microcaecilia unicolor TaxID=1415580 RepID=A0A6P7ZWJ9_9AMPH|nr:ataxin-7-like protein 2 [Microcaecilia unicolor]
MAVRGRAAAVMAALDRRAPSLDEFAGQSWSSWVERADLAAAGGSDLEDSKKTGKKVDAMTLIKEDMSIFGHCPAHDDFYLVVCNQCSQVVKPQAFQKHCERRHGALSKLYSRAHPTSSSRRDQVLNGETPVCRRHGGKPPRERAHGTRIRTLEPERQENPPKENVRLFMPVVNLEKIPSLPKPAGHGFRLNSKPSTLPLSGFPLLSSQEKSPNECLEAAKFDASAEASVAAKPGAAVMLDGLQRKAECFPASLDKGTSTSKSAQRYQKKLSRKECDLNRQCGVMNPDTKRVCTRLITCKIHSVHQRREVQGRAKDFDVLVAELKANARNRESSKESSLEWKDPVGERPLHEASALTSAAYLPSPATCQLKPPHAPHRISSDSDFEQEVPSPCEAETGLLHLFACPSEESEEEAPDELERLECPYVRRPPQPQAHCTFGSRLVGLGCYLFNRRFDRFCSAFSSMLERHLSSHMWKKIPPAADLQVPSVPPSAHPGCSLAHSSENVYSSAPANTARTPSSCIVKETRTCAEVSYAACSPHVAAACSQADCTGGSQAITSPLPANTPSPSFSKLPSTKSSRASRGKEVDNQDTEASPRKRKLSSNPFHSSLHHKRNCIMDPGKASSSPSKTQSSSEHAVNGVTPSDTRLKRTEFADSRESSQQQLDNRGEPASKSKALQLNSVPEEDGKTRKSLTTYYRPEKPKHLSAASIGFSTRRKKTVSLLGFEEKQNTLKSKAH